MFASKLVRNVLTVAPIVALMITLPLVGQPPTGTRPKPPARADDLLIVSMAADQAGLFADFDRYAVDDQKLIALIEKAIAEAKKRGRKWPETTELTARLRWYREEVFGARHAPPDKPGSYVVYATPAMVIFFGPEERPTEFSSTLATVAGLLPRLREASAAFGEAAVFPLLVSDPKDLAGRLADPVAFLRGAMRPDWLLLDRLSLVAAVAGSGVEPAGDDARHVGRLGEAVAARESGPIEDPDYELPREGNLVLTRKQAEQLRERLGELLLKTADPNFDGEAFRKLKLASKFAALEVVGRKALTAENVAAPLVDWASRGLTALVAGNDPGPEASARALQRIGQVWLVHRAMQTKVGPYRVAAGELSKEQLDALASHLRHANRTDFARAVEAVAVSDAAKATPAAAKPMVRRMTAADVARELLKQKRDPRVSGGDKEVEAGLKEMERLFGARPDLATGLTPSDLKRLTEDGATAAEWKQLQRLLQGVFGLFVAGDVVERAGGALTRDGVSREVTRSVAAQFGDLAKPLRAAQALAPQALRRGIDLPTLVHQGGGQFARRQVATVAADAARQAAEKAPRPGATAEQTADQLAEEFAERAALKVLNQEIATVDPTDGAQLKEAAERLDRSARDQFGLTPSEAVPPKNVDALRDRAKEYAKQAGQRLRDPASNAQLSADVAREWLGHAAAGTAIGEPATDKTPPADWTHSAATGHTGESKDGKPSDPKNGNPEGKDPGKPEPRNGNPPEDPGQPNGQANGGPNGKPGNKDPGKPEAKETSPPKESGQANGSAGGQSNGKPEGKDGKKSDQNGNSGGGDGAGGGFLPGDMPLFRLIFQNLARYLGVEAICRKILEAVYLLNKDLFNDVARALEKIHGAIVSEGLKDAINDVNKLIEKLAPLFGELDLSVDRLVNEGLKSTLEKLAEKGLDKLTKEGLKELAKKTGIPLDVLMDLKNIPKDFDPKKALDAAVAQGKKAAWNEVKKELGKLGVPAGVVEAVKDGNAGEAAKQLVEAAKQKGATELAKAVGLPPEFAQAVAQGDAAGMKKAADLAAKHVRTEVARRLGVPPEAVDTLLGNDPAAREKALIDLGKQAVWNEAVKHLPVSPDLISKPVDQWPAEVSRQAAARVLGQHLPPEVARAVADGMTSGKPNDAVAALTRHATATAEAELKAHGIDPALFAALRAGDTMAVVERIKKDLSAEAQRKLVDSGAIRKETLDQVLSGPPAAAAAAVQAELTRKADEAIKTLGLGDVIKDGKFHPESAKAWVEAKVREEVAGQLKRFEIDPKALTPEELKLLAARLQNAKDGRLDAELASVGRFTRLSPAEVKALLDGKADEVFNAVRGRGLVPAAEELLRGARLDPKAVDLNGALESAAAAMKRQAAERLEAQVPGLKGLADVLEKKGDVGQWATGRAKALVEGRLGDVRARADVVARFAAGDWAKAAEQLKRLDPQAVRTMIADGLLPPLAADLLGGTVPADKLAAAWREHVAGWLAKDRTLGVPPDVAKHLMDNNPDGVQQAVREWAAKTAGDALGKDSKAVVEAVLSKTPAEALRAELLARVKAQLKLPDSASWDDLATDQKKLVEGLLDRGLSSALGTDPARLKALLAGDLSKLAEGDLLAALRAAAARGDDLVEVAKNAGLTVQDLAHFLQQPDLPQVEAALVEATPRAANEMVADLLARNGLDAARLMTRLGNNAARGAAGLDSGSPVRVECATDPVGINTRLVVRLHGRGTYEVTSDLEPGRTQMAKLDGSKDIELGILRRPGLVRARLIAGGKAFALTVAVTAAGNGRLSLRAVLHSESIGSTEGLTAVTAKRLAEVMPKVIADWMADDGGVIGPAGIHVHFAVGPCGPALAVAGTDRGRPLLTRLGRALAPEALSPDQFARRWDELCQTAVILANGADSFGEGKEDGDSFGEWVVETKPGSKTGECVQFGVTIRKRK
jgi:DNA-binding phage protein